MNTRKGQEERASRNDDLVTYGVLDDWRAIARSLLVSENRAAPFFSDRLSKRRSATRRRGGRGSDPCRSFTLKQGFPHAVHALDLRVTRSLRCPYRKGPRGLYGPRPRSVMRGSPLTFRLLRSFQPGSARCSRRSMAPTAQAGKMRPGSIPGVTAWLKLLALFLHCEARRAARRSPEGHYVPLDEQDMAL